ncbi:MAG TPA: sensor histidine kinase [Propionibacteriaceae bacterium]|nr:sensor histidine kinase [Propionibacteriaceae bacterium]
MADGGSGRRLETAGGNGSYRHEALLWREPEDFLSWTVPFVCEGITAGDAVMVAVTELRACWLREALGDAAAEVRFVDMAKLGSNPGRILSGWRGFLDEHTGRGAAVRGVGEPVWAGRRPEEILECQLTEALLNIAVQPDTPFWLLCPYELTRLEDSMVEQVYRSHPAVVADQQYRGSHRYGGRDLVETAWSSDLPAVEGICSEMVFSRHDLQSVSSFVAARAYAVLLGPDRAAELAVVIQQLAAGCLHRGASGGTVRVWVRPDALVCEVHDGGSAVDPLVGREPPARDRRHAFWTANELCDLVQVRSNSAGTTVRVHEWL